MTENDLVVGPFLLGISKTFEGGPSRRAGTPVKLVGLSTGLFYSGGWI
jgi:hypothetical protein